MSQRHNTSSSASFSSQFTSATPSSKEIQQYITDHHCDSEIHVHNTHTSELNINTTVMKQSVPFSSNINRNNRSLNTPTYAQLLHNTGVNNRAATGAHHSNHNSTRVAPLFQWRPWQDRPRLYLFLPLDPLLPMYLYLRVF